MLLCSYCIQAIKSHGEKILVGDQEFTCEEAEEQKITCDFCGEYDDFYDCEIK